MMSDESEDDYDKAMAEHDNELECDTEKEASSEVSLGQAYKEMRDAFLAECDKRKSAEDELHKKSDAMVEFFHQLVTSQICERHEQHVREIGPKEFLAEETEKGCTSCNYDYTVSI
jgi:hypothetical protein